MPYTKQELENVDFYREFVDKLRYTYLDRMSESAATFFRDNTGALISFEDIETGLGIEDATFDLNGVYSTLMSALGGPELTTILETASFREAPSNVILHSNISFLSVYSL